MTSGASGLTGRFHGSNALVMTLAAHATRVRHPAFAPVTAAYLAMWQ